MSDPLNTERNKLVKPATAFQGPSNADGGVFAKIAKLWRPKDAPASEGLTATAARYAGRLVDLVTGLAYSADEFYTYAAAKLKLYFDTLYVAVSQLSTTGGENKVPQFDSVGNLSLGISNRTSLGAGGNLLMAPFREIKFLNANGTDSASIYLWDGHSGGDEMIIDSKRICFYWQDGMQFGSPASLRDGRHIYFQPNAATVSDTVVESPPVALMSRYWDGSANANQTTWIQVVPSSAAANTEVLNINFGGTVGSDHRITGGVTPVQINRSGILAAGTIQGGVWHGAAIDDAYISSAALWTPISGVLATSQTFTGTTTFADITGVSISLPVGTYQVEALVTSTVANGTMGHKIQLVASGTGVVNNGFTKLTGNGLTNQPESALNWGSLSFSDTRTLASGQPGIYTARFIATVTSGTATIKLQAAQNVSDGGNLTVLSGAAIIARKLQ